MSDPIREKLAAAVTYVLDRAAREPNKLGAHLYLTEAEERLVEAEALHLGRDLRRHRIHRRGGMEARVLAAWEAFELGERETIAIATDKRKPLEVTPLHRADVWVVHEAAAGAEEHVLTHGPSGLRVAEGTREALRALAENLSTVAPGLVSPDPYGSESEATRGVHAEIKAWREQLTEARRA